MNQKDFAIIVGISHYPGLRNLQAPERDAQMIYDWLISEDGGAVPTANIQLVTSSQFTPADRAIDAQPTPDQIHRCFRTYVDEAPAGGKVGRRLYIYMSGHGISPDTSRGGLVTADANDRLLQHVYTSAWVKWLEDAGYFEELVLWMDCCMDRFLTLAIQSLPLLPEAAQTPPGPSFIALAAPRPLRTVEQEISVDRVVHGVFTWTLLQGLNGHAANEDGSITGRSLGDYLLNTMKEFFNPRPQAGAGIAIEPEIVKGDPKLIFRSPNVVVSPFAATRSWSAAVNDLEIFPVVDRPSYLVKLIFPNSTSGMIARLWTGTRSTEIDISTSEVELNLERGLYAIEVPMARLRQGFEVTGSGITAAIPIDQLGETAIDPPTDSTSFVLDVDTGNPTTEIFIIDRSFTITDQGIGRLTVTKPAGIYKIKMRIGRDITEQIVLLDRDRLALQLVLPKLTSAAPLDGSGLLHEYHEDAIRAMRSTIHVRAGRGGQLCLMARNWGGSADSDNSILPWDGTTLVDETGRIVVDLAVDGMHELHQDPIGGCNAELDPGTYYLRRQLTTDRVIEQSLIVCDGWRTEAFLLKSPVRDQPESEDRHRLAIFMHRISDENPDYTIDLTIDAARIALTDRRSILNADLKSLLLLKFDNPMAGIIGAHLLIMEHDRSGNSDRQPSLDLLDGVVSCLRRLVGNHHPDVEALSLRCVDPRLRASQPFRSPPMLVFSWQLAIEACKSNPQLIPLELWQQVRANVECTSYFAWASDLESRNVNQQQLAAWIEAVKRGSPLDVPTEGTARGGRSLGEIKSALFDRSDLKIPITALETLWDRSL